MHAAVYSLQCCEGYIVKEVLIELRAGYSIYRLLESFDSTSMSSFENRISQKYVHVCIVCKYNVISIML